MLHIAESLAAYAYYGNAIDPSCYSELLLHVIHFCCFFSSLMWCIAICCGKQRQDGRSPSGEAPRQRHSSEMLLPGHTPTFTHPIRAIS